MHKSNINGAVLKGHLDFLINNGMIEERKYKNSNFFALTEKGIKVLKSLREVEQMFFTEKTKTTFVAIHKQSKLLRESVR